MIEKDEETTLTPVERRIDSPGPAVLSLIALSGPEAGRHWPVPEDGGVIGRGQSTAIRVVDPVISRRHAVIARCADGTYLLRDLESRFGVYLEGERVTSRVLADGDHVQLSNETVMCVRFQDPKERDLLDQMQRAALLDPLTGVANRRYMMQRLEQEFSYASRHDAPLSLLMIDVDHFKNINDTWGHPAGDAVLKALARAMEETVRREDVVARHGGDEFIILARGYAESSAAMFAERMRRSIAERRFDLGNGDTAALAISAGVSAHEPIGSPVPNIEELLARADSALYHAKRDGRDRVVRWSTFGTTSEERGPADQSIAATLEMELPIPLPKKE